MARQRYSKKRLAEVLRKAQGNQTLAAQILQCDRSTISRYLARYPDLYEIMDEVDEVIVDLAESRLYQAVNKSAPWAVKHVLTCKGSARGWNPKIRAELSGDAEGQPIKTEVIGDVAEVVSKLGIEQLERLRDILTDGGEGEPDGDYRVH